MKSSSSQTIMYLDQYRTSNSTNLCLPLVSVDTRDRWSLSHTILPFVLVYIHQMSPQFVLLLAYIWESLENGVGLCLFNIESSFESHPNSVVMDPFCGAMGILVGWLCTRARRVPYQPVEIGWVLLTMSPSLWLWFMSDDTVAQVCFGASCLLVSSLVDRRLHGRRYWGPRWYLSLKHI